MSLVKSHRPADRKAEQPTASAEARSSTRTPTNRVWHQLATRVQAKLSVSTPGDPYEREADQVSDRVMRMSEPLVQRTCAVCAGGATPCPKCEEEEEVRKEPPGIHRKAHHDSTDRFGSSVPDEFLSNLGSGQPLDQATRAFMEPRFGRSFDHVRIHTDSRAEQSARQIGALAYTFGKHIAFASGTYAPHGSTGKQLIAHELAHTVQQRSAPSLDPHQSLEVGPANSGWETEAKAASESRLPFSSLRPSKASLQLQRDGDPVAVDLEPVDPAENDRLRQQGINLPQVGSQTWAAVGGSPYSTILPGYSQAGDTCGAASLITALMIWDREHWDPAQPNSRVVTACNLVLVAMSRYGSDSVDRWTKSPAPAIRQGCADAACIKAKYEALRQTLTSELTRVRDDGRQAGAQISELDYKQIGLTLYFLWHEGGSAGLSSTQIEAIQNSIGLSPHDVRASGNIQSFDDIFTQPIVTGLQPDQFAQVAWFVKTGQQHVFLLGRLATGEWFVSDQGPSPAVEFRAATLSDLQTALRTAAAGTYWLFTGTSTDYINRFHILPGWTGVKRLGPDTGPETQAQDLVRAGAFLGEVDAGIFTFGDRLTRDAFVARRYSMSDAQSAFSASTGGGGLVIEMPQGVFSLYTTSAVSSANLSETSLDASDSAGGVLASHTFFHAWLILGTATTRHGSWFSVY